MVKEMFTWSQNTCTGRYGALCRHTSLLYVLDVM